MPINQYQTVKHHRLALCLASSLALVLSACATTTAQDPYAQTKRGAMIGGAVGAAAGLFVGDGELDEVLGTAVVGAGVGAGIGLYMDKQQQELEEIEGADVVRVDEDTLQVNFDSDILFEIDSSLLSSAARGELDEFALVMNRYPKTAIVIQGYTDSTGSESHNLALSERRAESVYAHLAARQVAPDRMVPIGYGEAYPLASNQNAAGRSLNRRVSILVRGKS